MAFSARSTDKHKLSDVDNLEENTGVEDFRCDTFYVLGGIARQHLTVFLFLFYAARSSMVGVSRSVERGGKLQTRTNDGECKVSTLVSKH